METYRDVTYLNFSSVVDNQEETQRVLKIAGHSELYPRVPRDTLILFSIQRGVDIWQTDDALDKNGFPTLLSAE